MIVPPRFNYIIPIFNKEDVLPSTLEGVDRCASSQSKIFTVIDGCTDRSEEIVDQFIASTRRDVVKIHMANVHMLRSVNAALQMVEEGFSIVMQDDIVLEDSRLEEKIATLYRNLGERLGVISFRLAANVCLAPLRHRIRTRSLMPMIEEIDFIHSPDDHMSLPQGTYGKFYPRIGAINGPNCIPWLVRERIGVFDDALAPYGFDDPEYGLRAMKLGYVNGLFPIKYKSDIAWGGTRRNKSFSQEAAAIHRRNRIYIWNKHGKYIEALWQRGVLFHGTESVDSLRDIPDYASRMLCSATSHDVGARY